MHLPAFINRIKNKFPKFGIFAIPVIFVFSQCFNLKKKEDPRGPAYAGSIACIKCHRDVYNSYIHTAHFAASSRADSNTIKGSFDAGHNQFVFSRLTKVVMEKQPGGYYQTMYVDGKPSQKQRFDIVFGKVKGETYAYWNQNELFQLPISYINKRHKWINSPGFQNGAPNYERPINSQCLNCHMSYAKTEPGKLPGFMTKPQGFDRNSIIYNIDCERCHGPAAEHVKFQTQNPQVKEAKYIATYRSLTREEKINMCAICHSGANNIVLKSTFKFKPGDTLCNYMQMVPSNLSKNYKQMDVHGDQTAMLATSKCFMMSNMDCTTCHDTHDNEHNDTLLFASRCLNCHNATSAHQCKLSGKLSAALIKTNCVACHMPADSSKLIIMGNFDARIHTHHITVYDDETQKVLAYLNKKGIYAPKSR